MRKLQLGKDALIISILTLITVLTWIGVDLYRALTKTEIPRVLQEQTAPLDPKISVTTLEGLEPRISFTQEELREVVVLAPEEEELIEEELVEEELVEEVEEVATESGTVSTESGILE